MLVNEEAMPEAQLFIGEVVETATAQFLVQSYQVHQSPPLGSFVKASSGEVDIFAAVGNVSTTGIDPSRKPVARGLGMTSRAEIEAANPQIPHLLRTDFQAIVVGHRINGRLHHFLPASPPPIHEPVRLCEASDVVELTARFDFLPLFLAAKLELPAEELIAACLRRAAEARGGDEAFLVKAGKALTILLGGDPVRLTTILQRLRST